MQQGKVGLVPPMSSHPCLPGPLKPSACEAGQTGPQKTSPSYVPADPSPTQCRGQLHFLPASRFEHSEARSAGGSVLPGIPLLTPSSSSMISMPMEARVVHLQLFVALTAQRLCALNLQTAWGGAVRSREGPHSMHIPGPKPLHIWAVGITSQHTCSGPALRGCPALIPTPAHLPAGPQH